ncbi:ion-transporting P-type ATPase [Blattamonas nauphoetae]|uniref:Ion-transporting P-type ATPase n=1 Tax=Blattamonas nauphoetae TaxID=2049346 RepID=A0ABQ9XF92_9EUKA|nr:ion-transporting P-type ATPase [Blattamonas nauphoetae]
MLVEAAGDFTLILLTILAVISIVLGIIMPDSDDPTEEVHIPGWVDGLAILVTVAAVIIVTTINNWSQDKQFRALNKEQQNRSCSVLRDGQFVTIGSNDLVVGDVVRVDAGELIPADLILFESQLLECNESVLTGESLGIYKSEKDDPFLLSGCTITNGTGMAFVICVGSHSQLGIVNKSLSSDTDTSETPLQARLDDIAKQIGYVGVGAAVLYLIFFIIRWIYHLVKHDGSKNATIRALCDAVIIAVTIVVAAVPEGLPLAVTLSLAFSLNRMLKDQILVRVLSSCETMGEITSLCIDKTGTLTQNSLSVQQVWAQDSVWDTITRHSPNTLVEEATVASISINNSASIGERQRVRINPASRSGGVVSVSGDSTDCGLVEFVEESGFSVTEARKQAKVLHRLQFTPDRKRTTVLIETARQDGATDWIVLCKGAPDYVLPFVTTVTRTSCQSEARTSLRLSSTFNPASFSFETLTPKQKARIETKGNEMGSSGMRVLSVAWKVLSPTEKEEIRQKLTAEADHPTHPTQPTSSFSPSSEPVPQNPISPYFPPEASLAALLETSLSFLSFVGLSDPIRPGASQCVSDCTTAGVKIRIVTGDSSATALSVARQIGIVPISNVLADSDTFNMQDSDDAPLIIRQEQSTPVINVSTSQSPFSPHSSNGLATRFPSLTYLTPTCCLIEGHDFRSMSPSEVDSILSTLAILSRSTPLDKLTLVSALQRQNEIVGVTGDGTNDAPALKKSDVGMAMGICGTDVAVNASSIVIKDDNISSIVKGIRWGRNVFDSIRKFIQFQLTVNVVALTISIIGSLFEVKAFSAVELLWINLIMDSFAALALATDSPADDVMLRPPIGKEEGIVTKSMLRNIVTQSVVQLIVLTFILFAFRTAPFNGTSLKFSLFFSPSGTNHLILHSRQHHTFFFNTFVFFQIFNMINSRRCYDELHIFTSFFSNKLFVSIWFLILVVQILLIQVTPLSRFISCSPLTLLQWVVSVLIATLSLFTAVIAKCVYHPLSKRIVPKRKSLSHKTV